MADQNKKQYVVINGRPVSSQKRRSLDGLSLPSTVSTPANPVRPTPPKPRQHQADIQPLSKRTPRSASSIHKKQSPAVRRKKPAPNVVFVDTPARRAGDHSKHRLPQSAALSEARAHRAHHHRQSKKITRYGSISRHVFKRPVHRPDPQVVSLAEAIVENVIPQAGPPTKSRAINQQIAQHHRRLEQAVATQEDRKQKVSIFKHSRVMSFPAAALSIAVLVAYTAYLNAPELAMRVAASRAGIEAVMPGYQPSGFVLNGPIEYTQGQVTLNFKANADQRGFTLTQQQSAWDSGSLLENFVTERSTNYEVLQKDGLTIYVYNGDEAAWVNRGLMFTIEGESLLDENQLTRLATSL